MFAVRIAAVVCVIFEGGKIHAFGGNVCANVTS